jgi:[ribosomal protein S5]-alanine N-acetyltransferase
MPQNRPVSKVVRAMYPLLRKDSRVDSTQTIRPLALGDARDLLALRIANREFMAPFDPARPDGFFTIEAQTEIARNADALKFAILDDGELAGVVALSNVVYGAFRSANLGYWVDAKRNGRGLATRAVGALAEHAFGSRGLHRLEAGTLVDNVASQRVLEKNGFELIGLARNYLHIGGDWRDHLLFQRTAD